MRQVLEELFDLLTAQKDILENLLELAYKERQAIIKSENDKLEDVVRLELRELSKLGSIEKRRAALHQDISKEFGLTGKDVTVSEIVKRALPDEREVLRNLQSELTELIGRHAEINKENRELIETHREYSDAMLNLLVESEDPLNNFYGGDGKATPDRKKTTGFFDGRA